MSSPSIISASSNCPSNAGLLTRILLSALSIMGASNVKLGAERESVEARAIDKLIVAMRRAVARKDAGRSLTTAPILEAR